MSSPSTSLALPAPTAIRALARAFSAFHEFDNFVQGLQKALDNTDRFEQLTIQMDGAILEASARFSPSTLTIPLSGERGALGSLRVGSPKQQRQFGPEDLHLMAGLADFLSAVLTQAANMQDLHRGRELLRLLLNQAPVGIAAYDSQRRLVVANELATRWIGETVLPFEDFEKSGGGFHLRSSGKLIYGEAHRSAEDANASWIVALHDLTPEQVRLLELMQRETYRMLAQSGHLGFALVESAHLRDGVLRRLSALRAALLPGEITGPYDAHRIGIVFPGLNGLALRARLRKLRGIFADTNGLRLGYAELGRDGNTPEAVLTAALQRHGAYDEIVRPVLLIHDDSAAVADTFAMVLGKEFFVMKSTSSARTRELLAKETFEGFVTELELRNDVSGLELMRYAREKQPGIQPFFTTVQRAPYGLPAGATEADALVLEKPFNVVTLTQIVRTKLLD
jgi:PAS domain-containing protein